MTPTNLESLPLRDVIIRDEQLMIVVDEDFIVVGLQELSAQDFMSGQKVLRANVKAEYKEREKLTHFECGEGIRCNVKGRHLNILEQLVEIFGIKQTTC